MAELEILTPRTDKKQVYEVKLFCSENEYLSIVLDEKYKKLIEAEIYKLKCENLKKARNQKNELKRVVTNVINIFLSNSLEFQLTENLEIYDIINDYDYCEIYYIDNNGFKHQCILK